LTCSSWFETKVWDDRSSVYLAITAKLVPILRLGSMVHLRLNTKEANPNPVRLQIHHVTLLKHNYQFVNFISALPGRSEDAAQDLLKALAAQVKP
jgi:hypothetical protein